MHNSTIRLSLYHYEDEQGKLQVNGKLKNLFKEKGFKWKTVQNEKNSRVEILECLNTQFKD